MIILFFLHIPGISRHYTNTNASMHEAATAALPTMERYKDTFVYNQVKEALKNGMYKDYIYTFEYIDENGMSGPLGSAREFSLFKNSNQLNINSNGNKSNPSSQETSKPNISRRHDEIAHDGYYGRKEKRTQEYNKYNTTYTKIKNNYSGLLINYVLVSLKRKGKISEVILLLKIKCHKKAKAHLEH
ncbi:hypothetical protein P9597_29655 [Aneurinibacillus migulanus]|uniref:hypothetical protein n=1 Tax=Aneurinibacillus migulanus TaxID=47500 RepID=UPI002E208D80|nr:hypothetical protein [Aneurinibacillus migulanus]